MSASQQASVSRTRWAAIGAAVAVSLGVGGVAVTNAVVSNGDRDVFVPISPCRLFDLRAAEQIGPRGTPLQPGETLTQPVSGSNGDCLIPADATAVAMNVTAVGGTADSYLTIWPSDVAPQPVASNLNWAPGSPPTPNKVDVKLSADGKINLYNNAGTVSVLADVVGYYADHNHDDRYYTKAEIDAKLSADITVTNGLGFVGNPNYGPLSIGYFGDETQVIPSGSGLTIMQLPLMGPKSIAGVAFRFKSMTYCIKATTGTAFIDLVSVGSTAPPPPVPSVGDGVDRTAAGCYTLTDTNSFLAVSTNVLMGLTIGGVSGTVDFTSVTSTWTPILA